MRFYNVKYVLGRGSSVSIDGLVWNAALSELPVDPLCVFVISNPELHEKERPKPTWPPTFFLISSWLLTSFIHV